MFTLYWTGDIYQTLFVAGAFKNGILNNSLLFIAAVCYLQK